MTTIALIDGDIIAFRCAAGAADDWGDGDLIADPRRACQDAERLIDRWTHMAGADDAWICLSPGDDRYNTFRYDIWPQYKLNRSTARPDAHGAVLEFMEENYVTKRLPRLEADDVLGILATSEKLKSKRVIVSTDKDLQSVPGWYLNPMKMKRPQKVSLSEADRWWFYQTLIGDIVDGYPGCPGVGAKKAVDILDTPHRMLQESRIISRGKNAGKRVTKWGKGGGCDRWTSIVDYFARAGLTEEDAVTQARLARILRREDYDIDKQEITLWHPRCPSILALT